MTRWRHGLVRAYALLTAGVLILMMGVQFTAEPDGRGKLVVALLLGGMGCLVWPQVRGLRRARPSSR